jgi:poly(3-hydroxybutyrate) depolymerase
MHRNYPFDYESPSLNCPVSINPVHIMRSLQKIKFLTLLFILSIPVALTGQKLQPGPQVLTFFSDADDTEQPYGLYIPPNYDPQKKYPLVIMLHGAGSNHRLALRRVFGKSNINGETDVEATRYFPEWKDVEYIVASPYARGTAGYQGVAEKDVYQVLADVKKRFNIDEDRTYLTGLSMGGGGTLWIGLTRPDIWAAIAPVCPAPPRGTDALAMNALNIPAHFFHGDQDMAVNVNVSRDWVKRLKDMSYQVEYVEYPGVGHDSWVNAYKDQAIFSWFSKFKRNRFPERVRFASSQYEYNSAYWITFDKIFTGKTATIDAKFTGPNQITIATTDLGGFTLQPDGHPMFKKDQPVEFNINGKKLKAAAGATISLKEEGGKWIVGKYAVPDFAKRKNAEGPIGAAFASRHVYVYGTGGNPSESEMKLRVDIANQAANWSVYRNAFLGRIMFFPRVLADREVRPSDLETCNLILFGTPETNSFLAKHKDKLPMQLNTSQSGYGLIYVFPVDGHYVVVNSGLPWWTNPLAPTPQPSYTVLGGFKDFVLFRDAVSNVVSDGYFTDDWKLKEEDSKKLTAGGVVTLQP